MSALNTPGQDDGLQPHQQPQDTQHLQGLPDGLQQTIQHADQVSPPGSESTRKGVCPHALPSDPPCSPPAPGAPAKAPSVRRACAACHSGKTRCSEVLPCQASPLAAAVARLALTKPAELPQARPGQHMCLPRPRCVRRPGPQRG